MRGRRSSHLHPRVRTLSWVAALFTARELTRRVLAANRLHAVEVCGAADRTKRQGPVEQEAMDRSAKEHRISRASCASSAAGAATRVITTLVVKELNRDYSWLVTAETITACAKAAIRDLRGSINPEALPEMAVRLAQVRLAETAANGKTPSTAQTPWDNDGAVRAHRTSSSAANRRGRGRP